MKTLKLGACLSRQLMAGLLIVVSAAGAGARQLSADEALQRLTSSDGPRKAAVLHGANPRLIATGRTGDIVTYYAFTNDKSTFFVSGDDSALPLLGYTDKPVSSENQLNPTARWWLGEYGRQIAWAVNNPRKALGPKAVRKAPTDIAGKADISPMVKTTWDQAAPYNDQCPDFNGSKTYTGCVATAMAQAMYYYKYPSAGAGSISYEWENNESTLSSSLAVTFDWNNMLLNYPSATSGTAAQRNAIASLMKTVGYSIKMNYGGDDEGGSAAISSDMIPALVNNFGYDKGMRYLYRDHYTSEEWASMIYDNLKNGPIIYGGIGDLGGHCFICDGYRSSDGFFHINWGWSGTSDGYFSLNALEPDALGAGGGSGGFNYNQDAILDMRLPVSGSVKQKPYMSVEGYLYGTASGRTITLIAGDEMASNGFYNMSPWEGTFSYGVELKNQATGAKSYVTIGNNKKFQANYGVSQLNFNVPSGIANGVYAVRPVYKVSGDQNWTYMPYWVETSGIESLTLTVNGSDITIEGGRDVRPPETTFAYLDDTDLTFETGNSYNVHARIECNEGRDVNTKIYLALLYEDPEDPGYLYEIENFPTTSVDINIKDGESRYFDFPIEIPSWVPEGNYYLGFMVDTPVAYGMINDDNYIVKVVKGSGTQPDDPSLSGDPSSVVVAYDVENPVFYAGETNEIVGEVLNQGTVTTTMPIYAALCIDDGSELTVLKETVTDPVSVTVSAGAHKSVSLSINVPDDLAEGEYYLAFIYNDAAGENQLMNGADFYVTVKKRDIPVTKGTITLDSKQYWFSATATNTEFKNQGYITRTAKVETANVTSPISVKVAGYNSADITLSVSELAAEGGSIDITYRPTIATNGEYPVLTLSADNADDATATLRTSWDGTIVTPDPQPGTEFNDAITAENVEQVWISSENAGKLDWHSASTMPVRSIAYYNGKLYVLNGAASSQPTITVLNAFTGVKTGTVPTEGLPTTLFKLSDIEIFDGKLIATNIATANQQIRVYCWNNDDEAPNAVLTLPAGALDNLEAGGAVSVSGTWTEGRIYISALGSAKVYYFDVVDGSVDPTVNIIVLKNKNGSELGTNGSDGRGTARVFVTPDGGFWHTRMNTAPTHYNADGTYIEALGNDVIGNKNYGNDFVPFAFGEKTYAAASGYSSDKNPGQGGQMHLINITRGVTDVTALICALPADGFGPATNAQRITKVCVALTDEGTTANIWANTCSQGLAYYRYKGKTTDSISVIETEDENSTPVFYNLQGIIVDADHLIPGIYIRRVGHTTTKILVR